MKILLVLLLALTGLAAPRAAVAGPFNDALAVCLVKSTSEQDRTVLMRWVFAAMAAHPQVSDLGRVSKEEGDRLNREVAALFWTLVSDRCATETRDAVKYEGTDAISSSFEVLGKVAMQGLMADTAVNAYMAQMATHLDEAKMKALFAPPPPASTAPETTDKPKQP
jgi:hypothetical protein